MKHVESVGTGKKQSVKPMTTDKEYRAEVVKQYGFGKQAFRCMWVEAWLRAIDVEETDEADKNVAEKRFERWWDANIE